MPVRVKNTRTVVHKVPRLTKDRSKIALIRIHCFSLLKMFLDIGGRKDERHHLKYETNVYVPFRVFSVQRY